MRISGKLLKKTVLYPGVEAQTGRSRRIFVIPRPCLSICILSTELSSCMYWSQFFSPLCAGSKCRSSGWCQDPILVEDGPTGQCSVNLPLSSLKIISESLVKVFREFNPWYKLSTDPNVHRCTDYSWDWWDFALLGNRCVKTQVSAHSDCNKQDQTFTCSSFGFSLSTTYCNSFYQCALLSYSIIPYMCEISY